MSEADNHALVPRAMDNLAVLEGAERERFGSLDCSELVFMTSGRVHGTQDEVWPRQHLGIPGW